MQLRKEIEPQLDIAEKFYSEILKSITDYTNFCDKNGDEENIEYQKLEDKLHKLTGKDITQFNLWEWWEDEGVEVLSFRIALPAPPKVENITKAELSEIVCNRLECFDNWPTNRDQNDRSFEAQFFPYLDTYYHDFLRINFKRTYNYQKIFCTQKDKDKNSFELSDETKVDKLWNDGKF
ncbi:hypothetical protein FLA105534_02944 [Flavobacterium bizetiae]|uniref:Uncharacterized protein n=1 Tax=Flavobacterium bizetiae TaxID=2704140 RepID=A0A6J4GP77_9FLAO|nr:hypothetical protein [Flavobacterium bizetiae]CAA9200048.1 hypothetical protein FLA105534_02944 [Flavobacterium bizetiae]CAD5343475.1 hypothetical protein FLA105535_03473 [Flavobacterium bizetiae]CAD5349468.1 hypothetical protein FLA105534_03452 [Flavobacterium bizetiae]